MSILPLLSGKYQLTHLIGAGGFGEVYVATDLTLQRNVAVKLLHQEVSSPIYAERFLKEARLTSQLSHPNTLTIYDFGQHEGRLFLVSELLKGESLRERLTKQEPFGPAELVSLFIPICSALEEAHGRGIIHRDLKPDNLFLDQGFDEERLVLLDFGIAKSMGDIQLTQTGQVFGTPHYMAPEQIRESKHVSSQADLYSLGVIFYEVLTGSQPYQGESLFEVFEQHVHGSVPLIAETSKSELSCFDPLISQLLSKKPEDRPRSAREVGEQLRALQDIHRFTRLPQNNRPQAITPAQFKAVVETEGYHDPAPSLDETLSTLTSSSPSIVNQVPSQDGAHFSSTMNGGFEETLAHETSPLLAQTQATSSQAIHQELTDRSLADPTRSPEQPSEGKAVNWTQSEPNVVQVQADLPRVTFDLGKISLRLSLICVSAFAIYFAVPFDNLPQKQSLEESLVTAKDQVPISSATDSSSLRPDQAAPSSRQGSASIEPKQVEVPASSNPTPQSVSKSVQPASPAQPSVVSRPRKKIKRKKRKKRKKRSSLQEGLTIALSPNKSSYAPGSSTHLTARLGKGTIKGRELTVKFTPSWLGKCKKDRRKTIGQTGQRLCQITWGSKSYDRGRIRVCLPSGKCDTIKEIIIQDLTSLIDD